jgi:hypothetical protein
MSTLINTHCNMQRTKLYAANINTIFENPNIKLLKYVIKVYQQFLKKGWWFVKNAK